MKIFGISFILYFLKLSNGQGSKDIRVAYFLRFQQRRGVIANAVFGFQAFNDLTVVIFIALSASYYVVPGNKDVIMAIKFFYPFSFISSVGVLFIASLERLISIR